MVPHGVRREGARYYVLWSDVGRGGRPPARPASRRTRASSPEGTPGPGRTAPPVHTDLPVTHPVAGSWRRGMRWSAPVAGAADRFYTSGIARQPGNFGLSDLEVIEKRGNRGWHVLYITGRRLFRPGRDCIEWGGCFLTRWHGGAEKHAENMFGLASVLGTQHRKVKTRERGVSGDHTASQRGSRWGWKADSRSPRRLLRSGLVHWD